MAQMTEVRLGARWAYRGQNRKAVRERLLRFVEELRPIHPFLEEFSWSGKRSGWKPMLEQPGLHLLTDAQWDNQVFKEDSGILNRQFWNRRKPNGEALSIWLHIFDPPPDYPALHGSGVSVPRLPDVLVTEPILTSMMAAAITAWQPDSADVGTLIHVEPSLDKTSLSETELALMRLRASDTTKPGWAEWRERLKMFDGGNDTPVWRLWLASGQTWPKPGSTWLEPWQSEPPDEEALWLGGTRYTWHKYAPWNLPDESEWTRQSA